MTAGQGYHLYVIELEPEAAKSQKGLRPRSIDPGLMPVYVGQSWYPGEVRFEQHLNGVRASAVVKRFGTRLRLDLIGNPAWVRTQFEARLRERELAEELCRRGYVVFGGH
jgi:hypothetical protein